MELIMANNNFDLSRLAGRVGTVTVTADDIAMSVLYSIERPNENCNPRHFALLREKVIAEEGAETYKEMLDQAVVRLMKAVEAAS